MKTRMNSLSVLLGLGMVAVLIFAVSNTASAQGYYGGGRHGGPSYGGSHHGGGISVQVGGHHGGYGGYHGGYGGYHGGYYQGGCIQRPPVIVLPPWHPNPHHGYRPHCR